MIKTYALYHIPGRKVGVTNNIEDRVIRQQGYDEGEFEILAWSDDIGYISDLEREMQVAYGYRVDRRLYKDLFNKQDKKLNNMRINVTEATTTFPCPLDKLKGQLMDELGMQWDTQHGTFTINTHSINWIMANARTSMFNDNRSYIYNKAFYEAFFNQDHNPPKQVNLTNYFPLIRDWAQDRGIYDKGNSHTQYVKLMEEAGELAEALLKNDKYEIKDAIGDMVVVLTNLAVLEGMQIENCIESAYNEIANRKGKMENGTFVKQTL